MKTIEELIKMAQARKASDVHFIKGIPPAYRVNGEMEYMDPEPLSEETCESYARELAGEKYESIAKMGELDMADTICGMRVRMNIFRQQGSVSVALRILSDFIPRMTDLGLPPKVMDFPSLQRGIVLVTGETGSGKSTTLASILNTINHSKPVHIITLEDPIEYVYTPSQAIINQREIGTDTASYADGLRAILREDPDVILIGEMRDLNTIETALVAAETGHLVFATLHTNSAADSIDRIVDVFPEGMQKQIRMQLSTCLKAVLSQQLLKRAGMPGRVAACELMVVTPAIQNLIREGKTPMIQNALQTSADVGSITMDNALLKLVREGKITKETAFDAAHDIVYLKKMLG